MKEIIKKINVGNDITFSCKKTQDLFDFFENTVTDIKTYIYEDNEFVIVEMGDYCIVCYNFDNEYKYFLYENISSGTINELDQEECSFLNDDMEFRSKILNKEDVSPQIFKHSSIGALYDLCNENNENDKISICEYKCTTAQINYMLVIKKEIFDDVQIDAYHGIEVSQKNINII